MTILKRKGYVFLLLFAIGDCLIPYILPFFYSGYQPLLQVISDLGEAGSPVEEVFRYSVIMTGTALLLSLPAVYEQFRYVSKLNAKLLIIGLASFAIGQCILTGLFSVNRVSTAFNLSMFIHQLGSFFGTVGMLVVPLFLGRLYSEMGIVKTRNRYLFLFCLSCLFALINGLSQLFHFPFIGLWQRLSLLCLYLPPFFLAIRMKREVKSTVGLL